MYHFGLNKGSIFTLSSILNSALFPIGYPKRKLLLAHLMIGQALKDFVLVTMIYRALEMYCVLYDQLQHVIS